MKTGKEKETFKEPVLNKVKRIGKVVLSISAALIAAPIALPGMVLKAARYLALAGSIASSVSDLREPEPKAQRRKPRASKKEE